MKITAFISFVTVLVALIIMPGTGYGQYFRGEEDCLKTCEERHQLAIDGMSSAGEAEKAIGLSNATADFNICQQSCSSNCKFLCYGSYANCIRLKTPSILEESPKRDECAMEYDTCVQSCPEP